MVWNILLKGHLIRVSRNFPQNLFGEFTCFVTYFGVGYVNNFLQVKQLKLECLINIFTYIIYLINLHTSLLSGLHIQKVLALIVIFLQPKAHLISSQCCFSIFLTAKVEQTGQRREWRDGGRDESRSGRPGLTPHWPSPSSGETVPCPGPILTLRK